jgi:carbonic anhydrase/acetyltransferase-like protein (isoleucine patch superfamily)
LEGCTIEDRSLIGVGSVVIHEVVIGRGSIVGANAMVRNGTIVPPRSLVLGVPATVREGVVPEDANMLSAEAYVARGRQFKEQLRRIG